MESALAVKTRSATTVAILLLLGHKPTHSHVDDRGTIVVFPPAAERDLHRYFCQKARAEQLMAAAQDGAR